MPRATVNKKAAFLVDLLSAPDADLSELRDFCAAILASRKQGKVAKPARVKEPKASEAATSPITQAAVKATQRRPRTGPQSVGGGAAVSEILT